MTLPPPQPEDLFDLAEELRGAGYDIGTQQHVAAQDLVIALTAHGRLPEDPRAWRSLLAPIFCSSPAEQDDFYERFDRRLKRRPELARQAEAVRQQTHSLEPETLRWFQLHRRPKLLAAMAAALLLAIAAAMYLSTNTTYTLKGKITSGEDGKHIAGAKIYFDTSPQPILPILTDDKGEFSIDYQAKKLDVMRRKVSKHFKVEHPGYTTHENSIDEHPPQYRDIALAKREIKPAKETGITQTVSTQVAVVPIPTPLPPKPDWRDSKWNRAIITLLPLLLFALWWLWGRVRRRMLLQKLQTSGNPHLDRIVVKGAAERLFQGQPIRRAIQELRRHRQTEANDLDVPDTVRATIRRAGMFTPRYGLRKTLPEYLLLIDRAGAHDEQARLGDEMCERLDAGGVFVDRYYFQHDPRTCRRREPGSPTLTLNDLAARHPDHRLLIFSDGAGLLSPLTGEPEHWVESFEQWKHRAVLTPESPRHWSYREESLAANSFILLPATEAGLASLTETIQTGIPAKWNGSARSRPFPELIAERPRRWIERQEPQPAVVDRLCDELRGYLGDDWQWLCACAVYPAVSWDITVYLGCKLLGEREDFAARLMALVRLPWFRYGSMPDWLRSRLIESMGPEQERAVRRAIEEMLLGALEHPKDGFQLEIARAEQEAKPGLLERLRLRRRVGDLLQSEPEESPLRDYVFLGFLSGRKASKLSVGLPKLMRRILYPDGEPILGVRPLAGLILAVAVSAALWIGSGVKQRPIDPLQANQYVEDLGNGVKIEMVKLPGGEFTMGANEYDDEKPPHQIKVSPFAIGKYEVTQGQWKAVMGNNPSRYDWSDDLPVETVSWEMAEDFIKRLNGRVGGGTYRLPTEAEWEYAARAGSPGRYSFGDDENQLHNYAWFADNSDYQMQARQSHPVGRLKPNPFGLYDVHGNVWEWCSDWYSESYYEQCRKQGVVSDPLGPSSGSYRVYRGGGWSSYAVDCRSADRSRNSPGVRFDYLGFRLVRVGP